MVNTHKIENAYFRLIVSESGGAVSNLVYLPKNFDVLRQSSDLSFAGESGLFPMLPMVNRIRGNSFVWRNRKIRLPLHKYNDNFFIHGDGWLNSWHSENVSDNKKIILTSTSCIESVCSYSAMLCYTLESNRLSITLKIKNDGNEAFPFGAGFHPFFTTMSNSKLSFKADGIWLEDKNNLPTDFMHQIPESFKFEDLKNIPDIWINNGYKLADGCNLFLEHANGININVKSPCHYLQVYKPQGDSSFICLEPQSQYVDAHNSSTFESLTILEPNQVMEIKMEIIVTEKL
ncbi:aldose epimerase family protein [Vibrio porteresiae]|uniref:Aldose 1-epimerase n=1 Tax=Vibrio porteresiae DSM 19223 TaxID=1123496 RepID=A0ABZ0QIG5_9VIBR|nr:aldose 1-epimerase [Vibrio porteresiae]WPC76219.1 aldose 1-epimerase [Vibrio porteresiae DSM 19223]